MRQMWIGVKFFCGKTGSVGKKIGELSTEEIQEITDNTIPVATKKTHKVRNENNQRYVSV